MANNSEGHTNIFTKNATYSMVKGLSINLSDNFWKRLYRAYKMAVQDTFGETNIWDPINLRRKDIHDALLSSHEDAKKILTLPELTDLYYGVDHFAKSLTPTMEKYVGQPVGSNFVQRVEGLYISTACFSCRNPEQDRYHPKPLIDIEKVFDELSCLMGFEIEFPNFVNEELGYATSRGIASERALSALYYAYNTKKILQRKKLDTIVEIGGGTGRASYYAYKMGITNYYAIDLPLGIVAQALFLASVLGEDAIHFLTDVTTPANKIRLYPPSYLEKNSIKNCIVLNTDSLVEMNTENAENYIKWASRNANCFYSVNHETFTWRVVDGMKKYNILPTYRFPCWTREGYVEELYEFA